MKCHVCEIRELRKKNFEESEKKYFSSLKNDSQKREWVGLTDEEIMSLLPGAVRLPPGWSETVRAIEAKLRERNA